MKRIDPSEVTPEHLYLSWRGSWRRSRREFIRAVVAASAGVIAAACAPTDFSQSAPEPSIGQSPLPLAEPTPTLGGEMRPPKTDELGNPLTREAVINTYNNYYEFSFEKDQVAGLARFFRTDPWSVEVGGLVNKPRTFDISDLLEFTQQERIYRMRCVEGWSMVIPWTGFPLAELLAQVEPTAEARFVRFETVYRPDEMPGQRSSEIPWPYVEGLRLDEAMHDLTILATGLYGKALRPQTGAPVRLVVPWKYGFKSIKSIVRIDLVAEMPTSTWMALSPREYGFYANVNPNVPHPRWSQATERRIGETKRRPTLLFNGYDEVAGLYEGMDLAEWY